MPLAPTTVLIRRPAPVAACLLAAAGTLPFLAGLADVEALGQEWLGIVQVYAAVIASFIGGIHWAAALFAPEGTAARLLVISNLAALLAWLAALLSPAAGFFLLAALFAVLLLVDRHLWRRGFWPDWFWHLRLAITGVVVTACLAIGALAWSA